MDVAYLVRQSGDEIEVQSVGVTVMNVDCSQSLYYGREEIWVQNREAMDVEVYDRDSNEEVVISNGGVEMLFVILEMENDVGTVHGFPAQSAFDQERAHALDLCDLPG